MAKVKGSPGAPRKRDRKEHLPNITLLQSSIDRMAQIAEEHPGVSLSTFYQMAVNEFIKKYEKKTVSL